MKRTNGLLRKKTMMLKMKVQYGRSSRRSDLKALVADLLHAADSVLPLHGRGGKKLAGKCKVHSNHSTAAFARREKASDLAQTMRFWDMAA